MSIEKRPYELSIWEDMVEENSVNEAKICIIGSNTMSSPAKAFNIKLNRKTNGENTLTFSIYSKYYDQESEDWVINPYTSLLTNERKVKLKRDDDWFDFIIKKCEEDSSNKTFTYTAKDQHIQELSKTGFDLEFDQELENNLDTAEALARKILNGTGWEVIEKAPMAEYTKEPVFQAHSIGESDLPEVFFLPYSAVQNKNDTFCILCPADSVLENLENLPRDDEGVLLDEYFEPRMLNGVDWTNPNFMVDKLIVGCRGNFLVNKQQTTYDKNLGQYVYVYENEQGETIYGITETEYVTPETAMPLITNGKNFVSVDGWKKTKDSSRELVVTPDIEVWDDTTDIVSFIEASGEIMNSGIFDNRRNLEGFTAGQEYVFRIDCEFSGENPAVLEIREYETEGGYYKKKEKGIVLFSGEIELNNSEYITLPCLATIDAEALGKSKFGIFISFGKAVAKIHEVEFFKKLLDKENNLITPDTKIDLNYENLILTKYRYYDPTSTYTSIKDVKWLYDDYSPAQYTPVCSTIKKRSITGKESNRFNLLQEICESFELWLKLHIEHDENGKTTRRAVSFQEYVGKENYAGFKYGINLKSIKRSLDSDKIVTKMIVKDNANEFAQNGFCSIARASRNPNGTNVLYNFDYYVLHNLLDGEQLDNYLYSAEKDEMGNEKGFYPKLLAIQKQLQEINDESVATSKNIVSYEAIKQTAEAQFDAASTEITELVEDLEENIKCPYTELYEITEKPTDTEDVNYQRDLELWNWKQSDTVKSNLVKIHQAEKVRNAAAAELDGAIKQLNTLHTNLNTLNDAQKDLIEKKQGIEQEFFILYARFIQEGSWISEEYTDDNLYYMDALSTLYTSAKPQVSYTIDVFDLYGAEGYENYRFDLGDKTFVEDGEFFGWVRKNGIKVPVREEVVISEITETLDDVTKNSIKVQNYKTQFDDLFQRIAATTESLQYNTGKYERFSSAIETDGSLSYKSLQDTIAQNGLEIAHAGTQSVSIDERGIVTVDKTTPSNQVKVIGGGIYITNDGGETWITGITGKGINANTMTTGQLNTAQVNIGNAAAPSQRWDEKGITAYKTVYDENNGQIQSIKNESFVRLDEFGLYGIIDQANFNAREKDEQGQGIAKIKKTASFALTWDGFQLGSKKDNIQFEISNNSKVRLDDTHKAIISVVKGAEPIFGVADDGYMIAKSGKIGGWNIDSNSLRAEKDGQANIILSTASTLQAHIYSDKVKSESMAHSKEWAILVGFVKTKDNLPYYKFGVTRDGRIFANSGTFNGDIAADKGRISNWVIGHDLKATNGQTVGGLFVNADKVTGEPVKKSDGSTTKLYGAIFSSGKSPTLTINGKSRNDWRLVLGNNFGVTQEGKLFATDASFDGEIHARSGVIYEDVDIRGNVTANGIEIKNGSGDTLLRAKDNAVTIGGINVDPAGLVYNGKNSNDGFGLWMNGAHKHNGSSIIMHAGANNSNIGDAKFRVYQDGTLYASNAHITGSVHTSEIKCYTTNGDFPIFSADSQNDYIRLGFWRVTENRVWVGDNHGIESLYARLCDYYLSKDGIIEKNESTGDERLIDWQWLFANNVRS